MIKKWYFKFIQIQKKNLLENPIKLSKIVPYACSITAQKIKKMQLKNLKRMRSSIKIMKQSLLSDKLILQIGIFFITYLKLNF